MTRTHRAIAVTAAAVLAAGLVSAASASAASGGPLARYDHLVVIYEENHSFDNLYGSWGLAGTDAVDGLAPGVAGEHQVDQSGAPYGCLLQDDANLVTTNDTVTWLDGSSHPGALAPSCSDKSAGASYNSAFTNSPFRVTDHVHASDRTCAPETLSASNGVQNGDPKGLAGGCTRDLVHRFYQEQYQLDGGKQDRYTVGSDAAGLTQGVYDTTQLPVYTYLHGDGAPKYVIADHFFQSAFGGSFLNHQYLIAAQAPQWNTTEAALPSGKSSVLDSAGFPKGSYPLYKPQAGVAYNDNALTQACGLPTTDTKVACGSYAVNTVQPAQAPAGGGTVLPLINDTDPSKPFYETNIGDELSAKGVGWAWYSGGWDDANAGHADPLFQYHHQPFNYYAGYAPGTPGRTHLKDEKRFLSAAADGTLPAVSFVKPIGEENEHPGYASTDNGESHLVDLLKAVLSGPDAKRTLVVVTYDEFGGTWDHVAPPGQGPDATPGPHDAFGPGTRIPALVIGGGFTHSGVDHTSYDTTSLLATIEHEWRVAPLGTRDAAVNDLKNAVRLGLVEP